MIRTSYFLPKMAMCMRLWCVTAFTLQNGRCAWPQEERVARR